MSTALKDELIAFCDRHIYSNEARFHDEIQKQRWQVPAVVEELKTKARAEGLWNLFLPESDRGAGLTNLEYAPLCEVMGRSPDFAPEVFNCSAPDTGNMKCFARYGTREQQDRWLHSPARRTDPIVLRAMTEPDVASSDATTSARRSSATGTTTSSTAKWWISGAGDPRCRISIFMGLSKSRMRPPHQRHP